MAASGGDNRPHRRAVLVWGHGNRHVDDPAAAQQEISENLPDPADVDGWFWGRTPNYEYRSYPLPNGGLKVGTYYYRLMEESDA